MSGSLRGKCGEQRAGQKVQEADGIRHSGGCHCGRGRVYFALRSPARGYELRHQGGSVPCNRPTDSRADIGLDILADNRSVAGLCVEPWQERLPRGQLRCLLDDGNFRPWSIVSVASSSRRMAALDAGCAGLRLRHLPDHEVVAQQLVPASPSNTSLALRPGVDKKIACEKQERLAE